MRTLRRTSQTREDERYCKREFHRFLRRVDPVTRIHWRRGKEPPDYWVSLGSRKFAVEVTRLMESFHGSPRLGVEQSLAKFVKEVERKAREKAVLRGTYVVGLELERLDDFKKVRPSLVAAILDYIRETKTMAAAPRRVVLRQNDFQSGVEKLSDRGDCIAEDVALGGGWEGELMGILRQRVEERLKVKEHKLRNINYPKILLFLDQFNYLSSGSWRQCAQGIPSWRGFHTVYVAALDGKSFVLYSEHPKWMKRWREITVSAP